MPGHILFFLILPRVVISQDSTFSDQPCRIFRGSAWNGKPDEQQLLDIAEGVRGIIQLGYSVDGHVKTELRKEGRDLTELEASAIFRHAGIYEESYDVVNPFGDEREIDVDTVWIVNFCIDTITHADRGSRRSLVLRELIESSPTLEMFAFTGPAVPPFIKPSIDSHQPSWRPDVSINQRTRSFAHRTLRDFDFQWRHVLRSDYNFATLRVLARAVLSLATFDYQIHEVSEKRHGKRGEFVSPSMLPGWEPLVADMGRMGDVRVVTCQSLQKGLSKARADLRRTGALKEASIQMSTPCRPQYMLLSVKGIVLCRITPTGELESSAPEPLFNGDPKAAPPSDRALDQLLWATAMRGQGDTRLSSLPIEIQDAILSYTSDGPIAAAKIGCQLDIGSLFRWNHGNRPVELRHYYRNRESGSPVESQIWFDDHMSGIVYVKSSPRIPSYPA